MARRLLLCSMLLAVGCVDASGIKFDDSDIGGGPEQVPDAWQVPTEEPADDCTAPGLGCACEAGDGPIDCYLEPGTDELGRRICTGGQRYCRDGQWSPCESLTMWIQRSSTALIDGPSECNACDPACGTSSDIPGERDLTPDNSDDVQYDATAPGVTIVNTGTTVLMLPDGDGDGVPDSYDTYPSDPTRDGFTELGGLFQTLAFGETAGPDGLTFSTTLQTADVYFVIDRSGSMGGEITNVQSSLTSGTFNGCSGGIIGAIRCIIPDAWIGLGSHVDYPVSGYGSGADQVWRNHQNLTSNTAAAQSAINGIGWGGGADWPESQTQALWAAVTGNALGGYQVASSGCPAGTWGYPCFRDDTIPIIVLITDADFHNGPNTTHNYGGTVGSGGVPVAPPQPWVSGNETTATAHDLGNVTGNWVGASGSTTWMSDNYNNGCSAGARDAVFRFTLTSSQYTTISLEGSDYDTSLWVGPVGGGTSWCNDDDIGYQSRIQRTLAPGDYWVVVDGWSNSTGNYRLSVGVPAVSAGFSPPTWAQTVNELNARGTRVITIESSGGYGGAYSDAVALANATNSVDSSGSPFVFSIGTNGTGISSTVVDAIEDLANYSRIDVTARVNDNPATPAVDERDFIDTLIAASFPAGRCAGISADLRTFVQCLPGSDVRFDATFANNVVMPTSVIQQFDFTISIIGDGSFVLDTVPVRIVVPPEAAAYEPEGTYWRDYDSTSHCASNERPDWGELDWDVTTPSDTSVRFEIRTGNDLSTIGSETPVTFTVPGTSPTVDIGDLLVSNGLPNFLPYLQVRTVLVASSDRIASPVLNGFTQRFTCTPTE